MTQQQAGVWLNNVRVGALRASPSLPVIFTFDSDYQQLPLRPVLGQYFEDDLGKERAGGSAMELPRWFANLIPESTALRQLIARQHDISERNDVAMLLALGEDLPGAVIVRPEPWELQALTSLESQGADLAEEGLGETRLRFSLAGVQLKLSMLQRGERWTLPAKGQTGTWLIKIADRAFPGLVENEFSIMTWAREAGFDVPELRRGSAQELDGLPRNFLNPEDAILCVRRYDRNGARVHQEDFAQVTNRPPTGKYDHVTFDGLGQLSLAILGEAGFEEYLRRLIFMIVSGNEDAHLKNWSLLYRDPARPSWSPLYDQVAVVAFEGFGRDIALKIAGATNFGRLTLKHLLECVRRSGAGWGEARVRQLFSECTRCFAEAFRGIEHALPLFSEHASALREHWQKTPILKGTAFQSL